MKILEVALLINGILWCVSVVYLLYAFAITILNFNNNESLFAAVFLILFATFSQILLAVLND